MTDSVDRLDKATVAHRDREYAVAQAVHRAQRAEAKVRNLQRIEALMIRLRQVDLIELDRLRAAIVDAPHHTGCAIRTQRWFGREPSECDCWRGRALSPAPTDERP